MKSILIVNSEMMECGIHQYGWSLYKILANSPHYDVRHHCGMRGLMGALKGIDVVIFNWHPVTLGDLNDEILRQIPCKKYIIGGHDFIPEFKNIDGIINCDSTAENTEISTSIGRPVFSRYYYEKKESPNPVIGSFGFAFEWKNFESLVELCSSNFKHSTLRLSLPQHSFGSSGDRGIVAKVRSLCKSSGVDLEVNEAFLPTHELIRFLAANHVNVFLYPERFDMGYRGLSSAIDYALSAKRPIAISDSPMFRHLDEDRIKLSKHSLKEILDFGDAPIQGFLDKWNEKNLINEFKFILG